MKGVKVVLLKGKEICLNDQPLDKCHHPNQTTQTPTSTTFSFTVAILGIWTVDIPTSFVKMSMEVCICDLDEHIAVIEPSLKMHNAPSSF